MLAERSAGRKAAGRFGPPATLAMGGAGPLLN